MLQKVLLMLTHNLTEKQVCVNNVSRPRHLQSDYNLQVILCQRQLNVYNCPDFLHIEIKAASEEWQRIQN